MIAELISTGTEVLLGDILNTNVRYLARECAALGFDIYHQTVVGDNHGRLKEAIETAAARSDFVILTGGLGGTGDDITLPVINDLVGNKTQDHTYPSEATKLPNHNGQAAGLWISYHESIVIAMPGPPGEMTVMFEREVRPRLAVYSDAIIESMEVKIGLLGEYKTYELMQKRMQQASNPTFATYAKDEGVTLRITAKADNHQKAQALLAAGLHEVEAVYGERVINTDGQSKVDTLIDLLSERGETLAVAEGITGGLITAALTEVPAASDVLKEATILCSDEAIRQTLGIDPKEYGGAEDVADALLQVLHEQSGADLCLITTRDEDNILLGALYRGTRIIEAPHIKLDRGRNRRIAKNFAIDRAIILMRHDEKTK